jgi:predicted nuclease of predicted toxin-antitoxin system
VKVVVDMNLGTDWIRCLNGAGHEALHWSEVGAQDDDDSEIMGWAVRNGYTILTADLDFGTLLASTGAPWPSVVQIRTPKTLPSSSSGALVLKALEDASVDIDAGALVTIHASGFRTRPLPI